MSNNLTKSIQSHEGFSPTPYRDDNGFLTIGYGTNIESITKDEAMLLLNHRIDIAKSDLKKVIDIDVIVSLETDQFNALVEFMYWLGLPTFKKFKKMIKAVNQYNFIEASRQMLDSKVGREYKSRTTKLAEMLRGEY